MSWISMVVASDEFDTATSRFPGAVTRGDRQKMRVHYNTMLREVKKVYENKHGEGSWKKE